VSARGRQAAGAAAAAAAATDLDHIQGVHADGGDDAGTHRRDDAVRQCDGRRRGVAHGFVGSASERVVIRAPSLALCGVAASSANSLGL
jgi:hypothetical protein